jgi:hypothetical protein
MAVYFASYRTLLTRRKMLLCISCVDLAPPTMIRCCTHSAFDDFAVNLLRERSQTDLLRSAWIVCATLRIWNLVAAIKIKITSGLPRPPRNDTVAALRGGV